MLFVEGHWPCTSSGYSSLSAQRCVFDMSKLGNAECPKHVRYHRRVEADVAGIMVLLYTQGSVALHKNHK